MKSVGVIAELNPMHKGHAHLFETIRKETGADFVVVAMSGDFVQRGTPAILDKYARTAAALQNGADLVMEIPVVFATASAEYFAGAGVALLAAAGVDAICFGAEDPEIPFSEIAKILKEEPEIYKDTLQKALADGTPFPKARMEALLSFFESSETGSATALFSSNGQFNFRQALSSPNNILGIEYAKAALEHDLTICPIKRLGNDYHDASSEGDFLSASGIRALLTNGQDPAEIDSFFTYLNDYRADGRNRFVEADDLSDSLYAALLSHRGMGFTDYFDCDQALSNRIVKHIPEFQNFTQFAELLKVKNYTLTRIQRVLLHILLGIKNENVTPPDYLRLLGFRKDAPELLSQVSSHAAECGFSVISKPANAKEQLSEEGLQLFEKDLSASDFYHYFSQKSGKNPDITHSPIVVSML